MQDEHGWRRYFSHYTRVLIAVEFRKTASKDSRKPKQVLPNNISEFDGNYSHNYCNSHCATRKLTWTRNSLNVQQLFSRYNKMLYTHWNSLYVEKSLNVYQRNFENLYTTIMRIRYLLCKLYGHVFFCFCFFFNCVKLNIFSLFASTILRRIQLRLMLR